MAKEISDNDLIGAQTLANITQRAQERGLDVRRDDVRFVLEVVSEADPWFEQGASANLFAGRFRNFVVARCRGQGLNLSADELDLIDAWFAGGTLPQQQAQVTHAPAPTSPTYAPEPSHAAPQSAPVHQQQAAPAPSGLARWWTSGDSRKEATESRAAPSAPRGEVRRLPAHRPHPPAQLTGRDVRHRRASPSSRLTRGGVGAVERVGRSRRLHLLLMKVPLRSSPTACCSSACVFMTIGPYQATGSSIGLPETSRKRMPSSPA